MYGNGGLLFTPRVLQLNDGLLAVNPLSMTRNGQSLGDPFPAWNDDDDMKSCPFQASPRPKALFSDFLSPTLSQFRCLQHIKARSDTRTQEYSLLCAIHTVFWYILMFASVVHKRIRHIHRFFDVSEILRI